MDDFYESIESRSRAIQMKVQELIKDGEIDARSVQCGRGESVITATECDALRRKFNGRHGAKAYAKENGMARKTVTKHLKGECNCANHEPELTHSNCFGWVSYNPLDDKRNLWNEYQSHTTREIAEKYDVHPSTIRRKLDKFNIQ